MLHRSLHLTYLVSGLRTLPTQMVALDASRTWILYWILHAIELLNLNDSYVIPDEMKEHCVDFLNSCQHEHGGYGGGPKQMPHLAPSFAAVSAVVILGTKEAYEVWSHFFLFLIEVGER